MLKPAESFKNLKVRRGKEHWSSESAQRRAQSLRSDLGDAEERALRPGGPAPGLRAQRARAPGPLLARVLTHFLCGCALCSSEGRAPLRQRLDPSCAGLKTWSPEGEVRSADCSGGSLGVGRGPGPGLGAGLVLRPGPGAREGARRDLHGGSCNRASVQQYFEAHTDAIASELSGSQRRSEEQECRAAKATCCEEIAVPVDSRTQADGMERALCAESASLVSGASLVTPSAAQSGPACSRSPCRRRSNSPP